MPALFEHSHKELIKALKSAYLGMNKCNGIVHYIFFLLIIYWLLYVRGNTSLNDGLNILWLQEVTQI
jgi:hypothetical protein